MTANIFLTMQSLPSSLILPSAMTRINTRNLLYLKLVATPLEAFRLGVISLGSVEIRFPEIVINFLELIRNFTVKEEPYSHKATHTIRLHIYIRIYLFYLGKITFSL